NYTLALVSGAAYRVYSYLTDAVATVSTDNLGDNGIYVGGVTLTAPTGYEIALAPGGAWGATATKTDCVTGSNAVYYYLRAVGGTSDGAISERKAIVVQYDASSPDVSLYSPQSGSTNAAIGANQKIILSADESVAALSDKYVTVNDGSTDYTAPVTAASLVGNSSSGLWYLVFDLSDFSPALTLANATQYTVTIAQGAFLDRAGNASAVSSASFTTVASDALTDPVSVVFTPANGDLSVRTAADAAVTSGQALERSTTLTFNAPSDAGFTQQKIVLVGGSSADVSLDSYALTGDLEVYYTRTPGAFSGTAVIAGTAKAGETLTGSVQSPTQANDYFWIFTWYRNESGGGSTLLASGGSSTGYTLTAADIGKTIRLEVTDAYCAGTLTIASSTIAKADYAGSAAAAPTAATLTETSVTLTAVTGYQYSRGGTDWQDSPSFTGLTSGSTSSYYQRVKATDYVNASATSPAASISTISALSGTVQFTSPVQSGVKLTASLANHNNTGVLSFAWYRGTTYRGSGADFTPEAADVEQKLTVQVTSSLQTGTLSGTTGTVLRAVCSKPTPAAPTRASATATSITLTATDGYEYSRDQINWQETPTFHDLAAGNSYSFYQRVKQTTTELCSASSPAASLSTQPVLTGVIMTSGEARYGMTILVSLANNNNTSGELVYTWKRGNVQVGTGTSYVVSAIDIGNQLTLDVTSTVLGGTITRSFGTVAKAYYYGETPDAPTRASRTTTKIVLTSVSGCEYSRNGTTWQDSTTFSGLSSGTTYSFYQRYKATTTTEASPTSAVLKSATSTSSSDSTTTSGTTTPTPTPDGSDTDTGTALYSYTLTSDDTRILYSVMKNLAAGNKTKDVVIKQSNVEITFLKGTMTDSYTKLWYDFGVSINNSIAEQTAKQLAGDAYVATVHFNYDGELPGTASIRIWLGAAHAGKTLYYYKLEDDNSLTFIQTAVADSTGWVTVTQKSCSDYVFLSKDLLNAVTTPAPSASASTSASATPTPLISADDSSSGGLSADGWFIAAIVLLAIALIVGGIWLYTKNRDEY
ncbi:MAG TPA: Ig-like domain-containing protein, partial [Feifaniaceae bacterium]|nr:Ig-like domain-containing protein [Feifaniaceae bacterium]